ncbi:ATP synthase F1 subunit epsilon [Candidatus Roizmanbacteria bacterium]|nr:ATP synthase F1 subunit epsilon [Candidatus Roizmanbacteria bacterium]
MQTFLLEIVTPDRLVYSEEVEQITVPSEEGQLTVLPHHTLLFANLVEGEVIIRHKGEDHFLAIGGGFVEVMKEKVLVMVSRAYHATELNEAAIVKAKEKAEQAIAAGVTGDDLHAAQALLRSTLVDLKVLKRRKRYTV